MRRRQRGSQCCTAEISAFGLTAVSTITSRGNTLTPMAKASNAKRTTDGQRIRRNEPEATSANSSFSLIRAGTVYQKTYIDERYR